MYKLVDEAVVYKRGFQRLLDITKQFKIIYLHYLELRGHESFIGPLIQDIKSEIVGNPANFMKINDEIDSPPGSTYLEVLNKRMLKNLQ